MSSTTTTYAARRRFARRTSIDTRMITIPPSAAIADAWPDG